MARHHACPAAVCAVSAATSWNGGVIMPYGGNDWLALTQEPTLEPELPICDPHHHFWDFRTERVPYQRYLLHELVADVTCGHVTVQVVKTGVTPQLATSERLRA